MRALLLFLFIINSTWINSQDFTNETKPETGSESLDKVLIIPFKSQFLLSEIDRGMVRASNMDVMDVRSRLSYSLAKNISDLYGDSINTTPLIEQIQEGNLTYLYHGISYGFKEVEKEEEQKKFRLKKKEDPKAKHHKTSVKSGQLVKSPVFTERYMAAEIKNPEVLEFIQTEYQANLIIVLTELDLMKNKDQESAEEYAYTATVHYNIIDEDGQVLEGDKVAKNFNPPAFNMDRMQQNVLLPICEIIQQRSILYLSNNSDENQSVDTDKDY